jgi:hypothetical protein
LSGYIYTFKMYPTQAKLEWATLGETPDHLCRPVSEHDFGRAVRMRREPGF